MEHFWGNNHSTLWFLNDINQIIEDLNYPIENAIKSSDKCEKCRHWMETHNNLFWCVFSKTSLTSSTQGGNFIKVSKWLLIVKTPKYLGASHGVIETANFRCFIFWQFSYQNWKFTPRFWCLKQRSFLVLHQIDSWWMLANNIVFLSILFHPFTHPLLAAIDKYKFYTEYTSLTYSRQLLCRSVNKFYTF